jgi:hypothetical protein
VPFRARRYGSDGVVEQLAVDDVGQSPFEAAQCFHGCFAGGFLAVEVGAAFGLSAEFDAPGVQRRTV